MSMTNWMDCLRIRWQVSNPLEGGKPVQMTSYLKRIVQDEGLWRGLWRHGLLTNCAACTGSMGTRIGLYPYIRDTLGAKKEDGASPIKMFAAGVISGTCGYLPWCPLFIVKTQLQSEAGVRGADGILISGSAKGRAPTFATGIEGLQRSFQSNGVRGLYRGAGVFTARGATLSGSQLATYDTSKTLLKGWGLEDGPPLHIICSFIASFGVTCAVMPLDSVFTAYQASKMLTPENTHPNVLYTVRHLYHTHGAAVFYRGWNAMFFRMFPTSVATFYIYEQVRGLLGLAYLD